MRFRVPPASLRSPTAQLANWSLVLDDQLRRRLEPQRIAISIGCSASLEVQTRVDSVTPVGHTGIHCHPVVPDPADV